MDAMMRYFSNVSASTTCLANKLQRRLVKIKEGIIEKQTILIHDVKHNNWHPWQELKRLQVQKNVTKDLVPRPTWEPGIEGGYRPAYQPWRYYYMSLFQWHNESVNVWTHLIGSFVIVLYMLHFHQSMDYWNNPRAWPHLILGVCALICTSASGVAHLLHSKSAIAHYVTLSFDYAAAGIYSLGMGCATLFYSSDDDIVFYLGHHFLPLLATACAIMCFCCCYGKVKYSLHHHLRRKLWFIIPTTPSYAMTFLLSFPRFVRAYFLNPNPNPVDVQSWRLHLNHIISFFAAAFFFVSHVPEVFAHGEFDMIGQGHQIWHVLLVLTVVFQLYATHFDYVTRGMRTPEVLANLPGYEVCFYVVGMLIVADLFFIFCASRIARQVVDEEQQEIKQCDRWPNEEFVDQNVRGQGREAVTTRELRESTVAQRRVVARKL